MKVIDDHGTKKIILDTGRTVPDRPQRILVAEDEHLVAAEITARLTELGYVVVGPAVDGEAAIRLAHNGVPDLAVLDIRMPGPDGVAVAKDLYTTLGVPSIILSAYSDGPTIAAAREAGVFAYLIKPASQDQIRAAIEIAWDRYLDLMRARGERDELHRRLEERKFVESAKWILVDKKKMSEPDAMRALQKRARDTRSKLLDVCRDVIETGDF